MIRKTSLAFFIIAAMCFPSLSYEVSLDGAESTYYGFPLPWNSRSPAASLVKDIYLIPAAIDIALFYWVGTLVLRALGRFPRRQAAAIAAFICAWGTLCALFMVVAFFFYDCDFRAWPDPELFHVTALHIGLGL